MGQGKQAKILSPQQAAAALRHFETTRYPLRDQAMFLLSTKAGLRAKEIAELTWAMVTDGNGEIGAVIALENKASKGQGGGRTIPLHPQLLEVLTAFYAARCEAAGVESEDTVIHPERGWRMSAASVQRWFKRHYQALGFVGCSSHSGRRTFITRGTRKVVEAGGSLRDVQQLAGHVTLATGTATNLTLSSDLGFDKHSQICECQKIQR